MAEKRPKPTGRERNPPHDPDAETREKDDSIEILEVVGVKEDGSPAETEEMPALPPTDEADDSIPFSRQELYDRLLRTQAEFENAKKRLAREREDSRRRIWVDLLGRLLPILDNFDRALAESVSTPPDAFRKGVALTVQQMREALSREGLEEISSVGEHFDPHLHEAVEARKVEGFEDGIVLEELRKGYRFQGQLLRPALVRVSAAAGRSGSEGKP